MLDQIEELRQEAITQAKLNCKKLYNFKKYGIESFYDRLPSYTSSIIKAPEGFHNAKDKKYIEALSKQYDDYDFVKKMERLIGRLSEPYSEIFTELFIICKPLRKIDRNDKNTILNRGYLKLALLDADIDYTFNDEIKYHNLISEHEENTNKIIQEMKAYLKYIYSNILTGKIDLYKDKKDAVVVENITMNIADFNAIKTTVEWINELEAIAHNSGLSPKDCIYKYIMDPDWKYLDTTNRNNLLKGILALAYLNDDIKYDRKDIERDALTKCNSKRFLKEIRNFQFCLHLENE